MPKKDTIKKVLVIGSGPIVIGQAAEFDYAGTQACRTLREENIQVILVNSNPATIMTDKNIADKVYIEPLIPSVIEDIIRKERPDSLLPTLGGQTGLNLAMELAEKGVLERYGVELLGTPVESIKKAEDREAFKATMEQIGEPVIESIIANEVDTAIEFAAKVGYPVIVRPAYTLGGTGGGIATNPQELMSIASDGLRLSRVRQILIEKSVAGWKEIEYEVIRDGNGNCIVVCNMENVDPVGIHTGDSIVVAPSQTLRDREYQMLRSASINIINALKIEGGCNVQFALDPFSANYYVIEVNPRVSRSSALASKATGYPIAKVATKVAIGYGLDEIINGVTGKTYACFEPALDYVVVKIPRWPFDKFVKADKNLGTKMKATGEVMAIGTNFEEALMKAVRSLELGINSLQIDRLHKIGAEEIMKLLVEKTDERLFIIAEALRKGIEIEDIYQETRVDPFFLFKIQKIVQMEQKLKGFSLQEMDRNTLLQAKKMGLADDAIAHFVKSTSQEVRRKRKVWGINPVYKTVDTCAAEFEAVSPYYYSTYQQENEVAQSLNRKVVVLGSGPIRIGQGIEFDYCSVHCIWALKRMGYEAVIVNNNPETVSTDFDISDRLYFEPLTSEDVRNILETERPVGVIVQFGGQTAIKLAKAVNDAGYTILGTQLEDINCAEDREEFDSLLNKLGIPKPQGATVFTTKEAIQTAERLGYPVLVRPSYVLGGQGMVIAYNRDDIEEYMGIINLTKQEHPILVDKYIVGKELEVDAVCDGEEIFIPGIMEHIERSGVHSGDSISVYPAQSLSDFQVSQIVEYTRRLAVSLKVKGIINIQFIEHNGELYVIEVNPRSSRTVPYISKVTGVPIVDLATQAALGKKLKDMGYGINLYQPKDIVAAKVPVFSFEKLPLVETSLGPEMKSTGEVLGLGKNLSQALYKGFLGAGYKLQKGKYILFSVANKDKQEVIDLAWECKEIGFNILATEGTAQVLAACGIDINVLHKESISHGCIDKYFQDGVISAVINTPTRGRDFCREGFILRRKAIEHSVPCITSLDTAKAFIESLKVEMEEKIMDITSIEKIV